MSLVMDYSEARPDPAAIKAAGFVSVMRYLADPNNSLQIPKILTKEEAAALHAVGLGIGLVFETTANEATTGGAAGSRDVVLAEDQATALNYPGDCPIFYAVDADVAPATVAPYFQAIKAVAKYPVGVYGSLKVVEAMLSLGYADFGWQTEAWSGTVVSTKACLYQRVRPTVTVSGAPNGWDENVVLSPFKVWLNPVTPPPPPPPPPPPLNPQDNPVVQAEERTLWQAAQAQWNKGHKRVANVLYAAWHALKKLK